MLTGAFHTQFLFILRLNFSLFRDVEEDERLCAACKIKKDFVLQMRGACKDSKLGMTTRSHNVDLILIPLISHLDADCSSRHKIPDKEC